MSEHAKNLEIIVSPQTAHGLYSNSILVSSSITEFTIDFVFQNYQQNLLQSRIVLHPQKAEELMLMLQQHLQRLREIQAEAELPKQTN